MKSNAYKPRKVKQRTLIKELIITQMIENAKQWV